MAIFSRMLFLWSNWGNYNWLCNRYWLNVSFGRCCRFLRSGLDLFMLSIFLLLLWLSLFLLRSLLHWLSWGSFGLCRGCSLSWGSRAWSLLTYKLVSSLCTSSRCSSSLTSVTLFGNLLFECPHFSFILFLRFVWCCLINPLISFSESLPLFTHFLYG